jgi:NAD(P)-dependent dehydrogenase (short-subunit alcohol dehydrogenase family)
MSVPETLFGVTEKVVILTGGMGQLGVAYATAFAARGAKVAILDVTDKPKITNSSFDEFIRNGVIVPYICNIAKRDDVEVAVEGIENRQGCPSVLINNAALDSPPDAPAEEVGPFETYPEASFDKVMEINVKGTFICCQVIGGRMAREGRGSVINVSSTYGILSPCQDIYEFRRKDGHDFYKPVAYSVSKSAILNLTRYLATYWAKKGVRVNTLTPGGIANNQPSEFLESYCARVPMGRMAEDNEMVGAVVFLASEASSYVTGSNIVVDGGWSAW